MNIETVRVHDPDNKRLGWRIINKDQFDPAKHELYDALQAEKALDAQIVESHEPKKRGRPAKGHE